MGHLEYQRGKEHNKNILAGQHRAVNRGRRKRKMSDCGAVSADRNQVGAPFDGAEKVGEAGILAQPDRPPQQAIAATLTAVSGQFFDRIERMLGGMPKYGENRAIAAMVDGVIAPFTGGDTATIFVQQNAEFGAVKCYAFGLLVAGLQTVK